MKYVANNGEIFDSSIRRFMKDVSLKVLPMKTENKQTEGSVSIDPPILTFNPDEYHQTDTKEIQDNIHEKSVNVITVEATGPDEIDLVERKADIDKQIQEVQDEYLNIGISETLMEQLRSYEESDNDKK